MAMLEKKALPRRRDVSSTGHRIAATLRRAAHPFGWSLCRGGDNVRAEAELRRAVEIYPLIRRRATRWGNFISMREPSEAEVQYRASVETLPNPEAWDELGDIYLREGLQESEEAWREVYGYRPSTSRARLPRQRLLYKRSGSRSRKGIPDRLLLDPIMRTLSEPCENSIRKSSRRTA